MKIIEDKIKFIDKKCQNPSQPPRYLYKYYRNLDYALDVIVNDRIHLDLPATCNDVFDSARVIDENELDFILYDNQVDGIVKFTHRDYKNLVHKLLSTANKKFTYLNEVFDFLQQNNIPDHILKDLMTTLCYYLRNGQPRNNRIICFAEDCDSLLMWAHYGGHLQGACLCFDVQKDPKLFKHVYNIDYTHMRNREQNYNFYYSKSKDWQYEKEWRIVVESNEEYISTKSCVGIVFGERMLLGETPRDDNGNIIPSLLTLSLVAAEKGMKTYNAKANLTEYKIDIEDR